MPLEQSPVVTDIIIGVFQEMQDNERRPEILEIRKKWGCDELLEDDVKRVITRIRDAADNNVSLSLTTAETNVLFRYMLNAETHHTLQAMDARRFSKFRY